MPGVPFPTVWLPVYKDYTQIAVWPGTQYVSSTNQNHLEYQEMIFRISPAMGYWIER